MPILDKNNINEVKRYDDFLKNNENVIHMYQSLEWAKVKGTNWKTEYVYLEKNGKITAAMQLFIRTFGKIFTMVYAERGPVCNIYDINTVKELIEEAEPLIKKYKAFVFKIDPSIPYSKELEDLYKSNGFNVKSDFKNILEPMHPIRNMILNIKGKTEEEILKGYTSKTRYNIRVAERKGVYVTYSQDEEDLKTFFELMKITAKRDGIVSRNYEYYKKLLNSFPKDSIRIYLAKYEDKALSGAIAVNYGHTVEYFYGASSNEKRNLMPNYLMQQNMIRWAIETNCHYYNFGGIFNTTMDNGLYRFKEGFCHQESATKFIGEIDKVYKPSSYLIFAKGVPFVKKLNMKFR